MGAAGDRSTVRCSTCAATRHQHALAAPVQHLSHHYLVIFCRLVGLSDLRNLPVVFCERLFKAPLSCLALSANGEHLAVAAHQQQQVAVLRVDDAGQGAEVLGYVHTAGGWVIPAAGWWYMSRWSVLSCTLAGAAEQAGL